MLGVGTIAYSSWEPYRGQSSRKTPRKTKTVKKRCKPRRAQADRSANRRTLERRRILPALREIHRPGQSQRSRDGREIQREAFPRMLPRIRRITPLGSVLAHHAGYQRATFLEMVCRRQTKRLLQLRRSASRETQK